MHFVEFSVQMDEAARNNPDKLWILKTTTENGHIDDLSIFLSGCSTFNLYWNESMENSDEENI